MADFPKKTRDDWAEAARKELKGKDPDAAAWETPEGIDVRPLYDADDLEGLDHLGSMPGFSETTPGRDSLAQSYLRLQ